MATFGGYLYMLKNGSAGNVCWLLLTLFVVSSFFMNISQPILSTLHGELLPTLCRPVGVSVLVSLKFFTIFMVIQLYPHMVKTLGKHGTLWVLSSSSIVLALISMLALPETCNCTLEDITAKHSKNKNNNNHLKGMTTQ